MSESDANFIVICCADREIYSLGTAKTKEDAHVLMKMDVIEHLKSCDEIGLVKALEDTKIACIPDIDDFGISLLGAWSNLNTDKNLDWAVIKINGGNSNG